MTKRLSDNWQGYHVADDVEYSVTEFADKEDIHRATVAEVGTDHIVIRLNPPLKWDMVIDDSSLHTVRKYEGN